MHGLPLLGSLLVLAATGACRTSEARPDPSGRAAVPVIREATPVAFTLPASDTLKAGEERVGLDEFRGYTAMVVPLLAEEGIAFHATTADSIVIERPDGVRRVVMLGGLDYPYGYVLIEPGFAESILTGVLTDSELVDEVDWYFGAEDEPGREGSPLRESAAGFPGFTPPPGAAAPRGP